MKHHRMSGLGIGALLMVLVGLTAAPPAGAGSVPAISVTIGSIAAVEASAGDQASLLDFLKHYELTLASGRADDIIHLYGDFDSRRRAELEQYFEKVVSSLEVRLDDIRLKVDGDNARVTFDRTDHFTDRESGLPVSKSVVLTRRVERHDDGWKMILDGK